VMVETGRMTEGYDLYSWFTYDMPIAPVRPPKTIWRRPKTTITTQGKNASSLWFEMIFIGYMWR